MRAIAIFYYADALAWSGIAADVIVVVVVVVGVWLLLLLLLLLLEMSHGVPTDGCTNS